MSKFRDYVLSSVSKLEREMVLEKLAMDMVFKERVRARLFDLMRSFEKNDISVKSIIMSAEDWRMIKDRVGDEFDINTDPVKLRNGVMGSFCGADVMVQRGFREMVAVPVVEKAEGCLMIFEEEEV
jgi:hypothetical protein